MRKYSLWSQWRVIKSVGRIWSDIWFVLLQAIPVHLFPEGWVDLRVFRAMVLVCPHWDLQSDSSFRFFVFVLVLMSLVVYTMVFRERVVNTKMQFIIHRKDWLMFAAPSQGSGETDSIPLNWIPNLLQELHLGCSTHRNTGQTVEYFSCLVSLAPQTCLTGGVAVGQQVLSPHTWQTGCSCATSG